jgi:flavin reductase (DIM6/NTAB) family NADH-FMN oxidoreductase RutF
MLTPDETYQLLRTLTSPVVAITSAHAGVRNGMIIDSAIRASIVPAIPRIAVFIHKFNFSHDLIFGSGAFALHLLRTDQYGLIHHLGFHSRRDVDKLATVPHRTGTTGAPLLDDCYAHCDCRVINAMDTGSSTCFLGDVVDAGFGAAGQPRGEVMTAGYFRAHIPAEWREDYVRQLARAQGEAARTAREIKPLTWRGVREPGAGSREP